MEIYKATLQDVDGISTLFNSYRVFYQQPSDIEAAKSFIQERLENSDSVIFVAVENGEYAGFVQLYPLFSSISMQRLWILNDLYVTEESRKKGVGKQLLHAAEQLAKETNAKGLKLQTDVNNVTAQSLYESNSWVKDDKFFYYVLNV
ncbi:acetyltransferase [Aneurinibacillus migulanus]|jgi:GNAT superfamily N-acetyltransferase|uniref:Acetyltransferase n=1 Tax=Aneurinibacillus migulanus TaxID=47500 RepID=A0A0D1XZL3_ANEMI|nr:GNAT family N-acetyltransferase [Aneurinibacillus migulanus]KIV58417.1 acetyltransferase [Aneurinibacillus migulanus]KIV59656.1 acetyltransferase [Aneurinibacillus migulanus]KON90805.1 acetyltransferase [Aneurinibacillus migulanus]KPD09870.1 acetyltransferase [Aneurinibacillus migulanus]MCP1356522.1 GNAT family N-acetyltransferase [Aneurinibacillus migulanus]